MLAIAAVLTAALAGATAPPLQRPPDVDLTIGVSGDLLPHLSVVARSRAARGRAGYHVRSCCGRSVAGSGRTTSRFVTSRRRCSGAARGLRRVAVAAGACAGGPGDRL